MSIIGRRTRDIPCPGCGYNLRGLVTDAGARCPECGRASKLHELKLKREPRLGVLWHVVALIPVALFTAAVVGDVWFQVGRWTNPAHIGVGLVPLAILLVSPVYLFRLARYVYQYERPRSKRIVDSLALTIILAVANLLAWTIIQGILDLFDR